MAVQAVDELLSRPIGPWALEPRVDAVDQILQRRRLGEAAPHQLVDLLDVTTRLGEEGPNTVASCRRPVTPVQLARFERLDLRHRLEIRVDIRVRRAQLGRPVEPEIDRALDAITAEERTGST